MNWMRATATWGMTRLTLIKPAYFQYTPRSTSSDVRHVVITSTNSLLHHLNNLHEACGYGNGVTVTWMPHFHDYGHGCGA